MRNLMIFCVLCLTPIGFASEPDADLEMTVRANLVKLRILDENGNPVTGLNKEDFSLRINGKSVSDFDFREVRSALPTVSNPNPQEISSEEQEDAKILPRMVSLVMDTRLIHPAAVETQKEAMRAFLEQLGPNDLARIYQVDEELIALCGFTSDKNLLRKAIRRAIPKRSAMATYNTAKALQRMEESDGQVQEFGITFDSVGVVSEGNMFNHLGPADSSRLKERMSHNFFDQLHILAASLEPAYADKSIFLFTPGFLVGQDNQYEMKAFTARVNGAGIDFHTILVAGKNFDRADKKGIALHDTERGTKKPVAQTGGGFFKISSKEQSKDLAQRVGDTAFNYYILTYYDGSTKDEVRIDYNGVETNNYEVLYGKNRLHRDPWSELSDVSKDEYFGATLAFGAPSSSIYADIDIFQFKTFDHPNIIAFHGILEDARPGKTYKIGWAATNNNLEFVGMGISTITVPDGQESFAFYDLLVLDSQPHALRFYLRDEETGYSNLIETSWSKPYEHTHLSSLVAFQTRGQGLSPLYLARKNNDSQLKLLKDADPFFANGRYLDIGLRDTFTAEQPVHTLVYLQNLEKPLKDYELKIYLESDGSKKPLRYVVEEQTPLDDRNVRFMARIGSDQIPDGEHQLIVELYDPYIRMRKSSSYPFTMVP